MIRAEFQRKGLETLKLIMLEQFRNLATNVLSYTPQTGCVQGATGSSILPCTGAPPPPTIPPFLGMGCHELPPPCKRINGSHSLLDSAFPPKYHKFGIFYIGFFCFGHHRQMFPWLNTFFIIIHSRLFVDFLEPGCSADWVGIERLGFFSN